MPYYISELFFSSGQHHRFLWRIDGNTATRVGVPNAKNIPGCYCEAELGSSILDALSDSELKRYDLARDPVLFPIYLEPGQCYPRMARPNDQHVHESPGHNPKELEYKNFIANSLGQLNVLVRQLESICQIVHPAENTFDTFGHAIRNLLILACTEVEMHWRGVLFDNGILRARYTTNDYVMLNNALKLNEYRVTLSNYPWLKSLAPYLNWSADKPSASLKWYHAYNAVKHNREEEFEKATLRHAFEAVAACATMLVAQFGLNFVGWHLSDSSRFFTFEKCPTWSPSEVYIFPYEQSWENNGNEIWEWTHYPFSQQK